MWFIIWTALLLTERLCEGRGTSTSDKFSITFNPAEITVQTGHCAVISCTSILPNDAKPFTTLRLKCQNGGNVSSINKNMISYPGMSSEVQQDHRQKVTLLAKGLSRRNCSVIINNIYTNETEEYRFKLNKTETKEKTKFENVKITVKDFLQKPSFLTPALKEGEPVTLTCTAPEFGSGSQPNITWKWNRTADNITKFTVNTTIQDDKNLTSVTTTHLSSMTFTPSADHHATNVTCIVTSNGTIKIEEIVFLNVTLRPVVLNGSGCVVQAEVMTCVCICQGEPMPLINWPILKNITEYNHTTVVSGSLVTSNINLPVRNQTSNPVACVCPCAGEVKEKYNSTQNKTKEIEKGQNMLALLQDPKLITAFVIGTAFSAFICSIFMCSMRTCKRKKKNSVCRQPSLNLETVTSANQLTGPEPAVGGDLTPLKEIAENGGNQTHILVEPSSSGLKSMDVNYASINYSLLKKRTPGNEKTTTTTKESDYAELKKENKTDGKEEADEGKRVIEERMGNEEKEGDTLVVDGAEDTALYSNVKAIMGGN